jgi:CBS domain-containing protein
MLVHQILQAKPQQGVVTIPPGTSVSAAAELLSSKRIGAIIVSPDGKSPAGILSERDIVREIGKRGPACMSETVDGMMTSDLVTCTAQDNADDVLSKMTDGRFRHIPVMDGAEMTGLISIGDVVKARLAELAMERDALQDMVMGH